MVATYFFLVECKTVIVKWFFGPRTRDSMLLLDGSFLVESGGLRKTHFLSCWVVLGYQSLLQMVGKRVKSWPDTIIIYHYIDRKYFNKYVFPPHLWSCFVFVTCWRGNWWKYEHHCVEWTSRHTKHEARKVEALSHKQQKSPHSVKPHATIISTCTQSNHGVIRPPGTRPSTAHLGEVKWCELRYISVPWLLIWS